MFRRGVGTMVLTERMQALGDHARSSHQRLIAERRHEVNQERDQERDQENRGQGIRDQQSRAPEFFAAGNSAAGERGETIMLETAELNPSPPEASPADDVIIIESIASFLAVDEPAPEPAAANGGGRAPEPAVAQSPVDDAPAQPAARENQEKQEKQEKDDALAARRAIIHEWQNWAALNPDELADPNVATYFFRHLEAKRPRLLDFPAEDKLKKVRTWLVESKLVKG